MTKSVSIARYSSYPRIDVRYIWPAPAVIPAPRAYINTAVVKTPVVNLRVCMMQLVPSEDGWGELITLSCLLLVNFIWAGPHGPRLKIAPYILVHGSSVRPFGFQL